MQQSEEEDESVQNNACCYTDRKFRIRQEMKKAKYTH
jgi:hypothetical protein